MVTLPMEDHWGLEKSGVASREYVRPGTPVRVNCTVPPFSCTPVKKALGPGRNRRLRCVSRGALAL